MKRLLFLGLALLLLFPAAQAILDPQPMKTGPLAPLSLVLGPTPTVILGTPLPPNTPPPTPTDVTDTPVPPTTPWPRPRITPGPIHLTPTAMLQSG